MVAFRHDRYFDKIQELQDCIDTRAEQVYELDTILFGNKAANLPEAYGTYIKDFQKNAITRANKR